MRCCRLCNLGINFISIHIVWSKFSFYEKTTKIWHMSTKWKIALNLFSIYELCVVGMSKEKNYLICDKKWNFRIFTQPTPDFFWSAKLRLPSRAETAAWKKIILHNISEIRNFVTYYITFLLTRQPRWYQRFQSFNCFYYSENVWNIIEKL